jgi:hypothetical protein
VEFGGGGGDAEVAVGTNARSTRLSEQSSRMCGTQVSDGGRWL